MSKYTFVPFQFERVPHETSLKRAQELYRLLKTRRSVRVFSPDPVPVEVVDECIRIAGTAPSGANMQPWRFVVVTDPNVRRQIRDAAEKEERENYDRRFPKEWLDALAPLATDWHKEFLETAPYLVVVFRIDFGLEDTDE